MAHVLQLFRNCSVDVHVSVALERFFQKAMRIAMVQWNILCRKSTDGVSISCHVKGNGYVPSLPGPTGGYHAKSQTDILTGY